MTLTILQPPVIEPVELDYAKQFLRIDHIHEDALIADMLSAARAQVERHCGKALIVQRVVKTYHANVGSRLRLTPGPVQAVFEVRAISEAGQAYVVPSEDYTAHLTGELGRLHLSPQRNWQSYSSNPVDRIELEMECGYGTSGADVPHPLRQAILLLTARSYERGAADRAEDLPFMAQAILMPYMEPRL